MLVNHDHNASLLRPILMDEVEEVAKQTPKGKSPGPYGFTLDFFHYCWHFIKSNVWNVIEESRKMMGALPSFNATFLTLIPKEDLSTHPKDFHPSVQHHLQNHHQNPC